MGKKRGGAKGAGGGGGGPDKDLQTEDQLAAVILADSFNQRFRPLTLEQPRVRCLC